MMTTPIYRKHRVPRYKPGHLFLTEDALKQKAPLPLPTVPNVDIHGDLIIPLPDTSWSRKTMALRCPQVVYTSFGYFGSPSYGWIYESEFTPVEPFGDYVDGDTYYTNQVAIGVSMCSQFSDSFGTSKAQIYWNPAYIEFRKWESWIPQMQGIFGDQRKNKTWIEENTLAAPWSVNDSDSSTIIDFVPGSKFMGTDFLWIQICGINSFVADDPAMIDLIKALYDGCPNFRIMFFPGNYVLPLIDRDDFRTNAGHLYPAWTTNNDPNCQDSLNGVIQFHQGVLDRMQQGLRDLGETLAPYNATVTEGGVTGDDLMDLIADWYGFKVGHEIVDNPDPKYFQPPYAQV